MIIDSGGQFIMLGGVNIGVGVCVGWCGPFVCGGGVGVPLLFVEASTWVCPYFVSV